MLLADVTGHLLGEAMASRTFCPLHPSWCFALRSPGVAVASDLSEVGCLNLLGVLGPKEGQVLGAGRG